MLLKSTDSVKMNKERKVRVQCKQVLLQLKLLMYSEAVYDNKGASNGSKDN